MKEKWTPGPWETVVHGERDSRVGANTLLAIVYSTTFRDRENQEANARLIARAPDLYEALSALAHEAQGFLALADRESHGNTNITVMRSRIRDAFNALANARGETIMEPSRADTCDPADDTELRTPYEIQEDRCPPRE